MNQDVSRLLEALPETAEAEPRCALAPMDAELGLIRVSGEDARTFLQGQLTNDIQEVSTHHGQLSAWCNPKGRMLAIVLIFQRQDALYLVLPRERLETIRQRLQMFVLRARVTLEAVTDAFSVCALGGPCAAELAPDAPWAIHSEEGLTLMRLPGPNRVLAVGPPSEMEAWVQARSFERVPLDWWRRMNLLAPLPLVYDTTAEAWIPQMCNLDLLGGISFTKGCYTGQEVVARMKYLGQLKRRMYRARCAAEIRPRPGDRLYSPQSQSAQGAGAVVEAAPDPEGGWQLLVVTQIALAEAEAPLHLGDPDGPLLTLEPVPAQPQE